MSKPADYSNQINALERKMRYLNRSIVGISNVKLDEIEDSDISAFEAKFLQAKEDWSDFRSSWDQRDSLHLLVGDSDKFPTTDWDKLYDTLRSEIIAANGILLSLKNRASSKRIINDQANITSQIHPGGPELDKIPIPTFAGDLLKWSHFRDTFRSMVHNRLNLSKVEKFHYLIAALKGEAAALISKFAVSEDSYIQAWEKVVNTYDNPRILARLLVHRIVDSNNASSKNESNLYNTFLTDVADSIETFNALKLENPCEFILSTLALRALDSETRKQFELSRESSKELPTTEDVINFVRQRKLALKMSQDVQVPSASRPSALSSNSSPSTSRLSYPNRNSPKYKTVAFHATSDSTESSPSGSRDHSPTSRKRIQCLYCKGSHICARCDEFAKLNLEQRTDKIRSWNACLNCLTKGHRVADCRSIYRCRHCRKKHHTLVHRFDNHTKKEDPPQQIREAPDALTDDKSFIGFGSAEPSCSSSTVLLGTVRTLIRGSRGDYHSAHGLIDSGSQHTFMTSTLASKIGAKVSPSKISITSLAGSALPMHLVKGSTQCVLRPYAGNKEFKVTTLVIDHITSKLPSTSLPTSVTNKLMDLPLADHQFGEPKAIDILIGGDIFHQIISGASKPSVIEGLSLIPTTFGLVVTGTTNAIPLSPHHSFFIERDHSIEDQMKRFWEIEEPKPVDRTNPEDAYCEEFFSKTHTRDDKGRFVVRLPFKEGIFVGDNRDVAYRRFYSLEARFRKDPEFFLKYSQFMQEYIDLGHMSRAKSKSLYLIPHHGIWQDGPHATKKLRVVFDASCPSSSGYSLNDALLSGPKLQEDLCNVLIRFRLYAIPLCADLVKMYRQVLVHEEDRKFQHILWRDSPNKAIEIMELNTVTYGLKPSAYQALRTVRQLVQIYGSDFPLAARRILENSYVDDLCSGADSLNEALELQIQLRELFAKGGFALSKWASTEPMLLPATEEHCDSVSIQIDDTTKILGLLWNSANDSFSYSVKTPQHHCITKRHILSSISRIFDPLGLLAPVVFTAKSLLQEIWKAKIDWDEELPDHLQVSWTELTMNWHTLSTISIQRYINQPDAERLLVGFCDASSKGYGAALYLLAKSANGDVKTSLVKAKTKVAPLKFTSIPRLELCGAVLLSRLISSVPQSLATSIICFSDSQVVLSWLHTPFYELKVFEANRVSQILTVVPAHRWRHVNSEDNPADLASRGCSPEHLKESKLWWSGPSWLQTSDAKELLMTEEPTSIAMISTAGKNENPNDEWISRFSSYRTLIRTVARILRLISSKRSSTSSSTNPISASEFTEAELRCALFVQRAQFPKEFFKDPLVVPKDYVQLSPFFDERGILRVGGRLKNSPLDFSSKHPILLPHKSHLAVLVVDYIHVTHFHAGPSLTLALLRGKYWIPKAAKIIRGRILRCVHCRLTKAKPSAPLMAALPKERFNQFRAFIQVGVDYAGPFAIKESKRRNASLGKAYLCLFVCLSSKALHLELVSSLSTSAFLDALDRFISRRGVPNTIWSDHGTNFVGASRFLKDLYKFQWSIESEVTNHLSRRGISWKFIPPRAPHFGGLWEAGVKSVKGLLVNSTGKQPFTFEELTTALAKIEFLLNSRPLCALTEDTQDFDFLTPGHFLTGAPLGFLPDSHPESDPSGSPLLRWKSVKAQITSVWARWRKEYLHHLQVRTKWTKSQPSIKSGDLVILLEKKSLLGQWPVGRVTSTYPGRDGVTRIVDIITPSGKTLKRAVTSLVPLLYPESEDRSGT